jgi:hypothetical protein
MLIKFIAAILWLIFMSLTACIVIRNGAAIGGWDGWLSIGIGIGCSLLASFGSIATFSVWDKRKGAARGAAGVVLAVLCWVCGEASVVLNELAWRSSAIESKTDDREDANLARNGARQQLKKAQDALTALPEARSLAAIAADEKVALAEPVRWKRENTTIGDVTKRCTDAEHDLYRKCAQVLRLRTESANAANVFADRRRLAADMETARGELRDKPEVGDVSAASRWLADRSGHSKQTWETVGTVIMLLVFALGRDAPGCVVGALRDDSKDGAIAKSVFSDHPEEILSGAQIQIRRLDVQRVIAWPQAPEPCVLSLVRVTTPQIKSRLPEIVTSEALPKERAPEAEDVAAEPILALPAPEAKKKTNPSKRDLGPNVTMLRPVDRRPGWETREWLRETLTDGPQKRADIVRLGGAAGISEGALDRAAKSMPEVSIAPGKGKRPAIWGLQKQAGQKRPKAISAAER